MVIGFVCIWGTLSCALPSCGFVGMACWMGWFGKFRIGNSWKAVHLKVSG